MVVAQWLHAARSIRAYTVVSHYQAGHSRRRGDVDGLGCGLALLHGCRQRGSYGYIGRRATAQIIRVGCGNRNGEGARTRIGMGRAGSG